MAFPSLTAPAQALSFSPLLASGLLSTLLVSPLLSSPLHCLPRGMARRVEGTRDMSRRGEERRGQTRGGKQATQHSAAHYSACLDKSTSSASHSWSCSHPSPISVISSGSFLPRLGLSLTTKQRSQRQQLRARA